MTYFRRLPEKLENVRVNVRYVCRVCKRVYKKQKMDPKFHELKTHGAGESFKVPFFDQRITINGADVSQFDPRDLIILRQKGILRTPAPVTNPTEE